MIEQQGRVVEHLSAGAKIEVGPLDGCSRCASGKGCGAGLFVRLINRKPTQLLIDSDKPLSAGDSVIVGIPETLFLRWVAQLYGLPLLAGFAVAIPVQFLAGKFQLAPGLTDVAVLTGAVLGFLSMLFILRGRLNAGVPDTGVQLVSDGSSVNSAACTAGN